MRGVLFLLAAMALLATALPASAAEPRQLTVAAMESNCPDGKAFCLEVTAGDPSQLMPGDQVTVEFRNDGGGVHNLFVAPSAAADPAHKNTEGSRAFGASENIGGGEKTSVSFAVPADATGLYYWCDVGGHEQLGMWLQSALAGSPAPPAQAPAAKAQAQAPAAASARATPLPGGLALLALAGLALVLQRREGDP